MRRHLKEPKTQSQETGDKLLPLFKKPEEWVKWTIGEPIYSYSFLSMERYSFYFLRYKICSFLTNKNKHHRNRLLNKECLGTLER